MAPWVRRVFIHILPRLLAMRRPQCRIDEHSKFGRHVVVRTCNGSELRDTMGDNGGGGEFMRRATNNRQGGVAVSSFGATSRSVSLFYIRMPNFDCDFQIQFINFSFVTQSTTVVLSFFFFFIWQSCSHDRESLSRSRLPVTTQFRHGPWRYDVDDDVGCRFIVDDRIHQNS